MANALFNICGLIYLFSKICIKRGISNMPFEATPSLYVSFLCRRQWYQHDAIGTSVVGVTLAPRSEGCHVTCDKPSSEATRPYPKVSELGTWS